jgi:uncharacterized protein DUF6064
MSEWWTYRLSDFLLFSPRTYYRLIERYNAAVWPAHVLMLALGAGILWMLLRPAAVRSRAIAVLLAALWAWVAWAFVWRRYATINWAAMYFVWLFAIEAVLLGWIGVVRRGLRFRVVKGTAGVAGVVLLAFAVFVYPILAPAAGREWRQAEVFGIAPDPTVIGTLGILLLAESRARTAVLVVPGLLVAISGATLWAMASPEKWVMPCVLLFVAVALRRDSSSREAPGTGDARAAARRETNL